MANKVPRSQKEKEPTRRSQGQFRTSCDLDITVFFRAFKKRLTERTKQSRVDPHEISVDVAFNLRDSACFVSSQAISPNQRSYFQLSQEIQWSMVGKMEMFMKIPPRGHPILTCLFHHTLCRARAVTKHNPTIRLGVWK